MCYRTKCSAPALTHRCVSPSDSQQVAAHIKQLGKKDGTTRWKALGALEEHLREERSAASSCLGAFVPASRKTLLQCLLVCDCHR